MFRVFIGLWAKPTLEKEELITGEVIHQRGIPSKKVFSITEQGKKAIMEWMQQEPELPGFKHEFLMKLSFSSRLPYNDIITQLSGYKETLMVKLTELESKRKLEYLNFARDEKELFLWEMTFENGIMYYQNELEWVDKVIKLIQDRIQQ